MYFEITHSGIGFLRRCSCAADVDRLFDILSGIKEKRNVEAIFDLLLDLLDHLSHRHSFRNNRMPAMHVSHRQSRYRTRDGILREDGVSDFFIFADAPKHCVDFGVYDCNELQEALRVSQVCETSG